MGRGGKERGGKRGEGGKGGDLCSCEFSLKNPELNTVFIFIL